MNGQGQGSKGTEIADLFNAKTELLKDIQEEGIKTMTKMKKLAAVIMLAAVMTMGVPQAKAGFILTGFADNPTDTTTTKTDDTVTNDPNAASDTDVTVLDGIILTLEGILICD